MMVTAVMPTTESRRGFWDGAIRCFLAQTYTNSELLIVEEAGTHSTREFPDRVNYICLPPGRKLTTGTKRNVANGYALGGVISHFDDDDWSHPRRIEDQVNLLQACHKEVVGYHDLLMYRHADRSFWKYTYQAKPPYGSGTTLCYLRSWWEAHPFMDISTAEDTEFSAEAARHGVMASTPCNGLMVARVHPGNTFKSVLGRNPFFKTDRNLVPQEFLNEVSH
jgi:glycosyltransferase involved in cell wall biosynthesis